MALADAHTGGSRAMMVRWRTEANGRTAGVGVASNTIVLQARRAIGGGRR